MLRQELCFLIDGIYQDEGQERYLRSPHHLDARFFENTKVQVLGNRDHSAIVLAAEHVLTNQNIEPERLVDVSFEYDMEEDAYPILREWRRRWWGQLQIPKEWVNDVVLTEESMAVWVARRKSGKNLPPYVPVRAMDARHGIAGIGWKLVEEGESWQRLHWKHSNHDFILPPDPTLLEEIAIQILVAWMRHAGGTPAPTPTSTPKSARALADTARAANLPGCAALFDAIAAHPERPETTGQLRVAQTLLETYLSEDPTTQR
ncbi:MAG: hypothetical protein H6741_10330 [Alphaproteobacteria bacterium]|nr:hypothetical protein [Alphaproteobacteria bacterium]MCB9793111.1 hypothetical protein [Alphaproteobacteria bacterium]